MTLTLAKIAQRAQDEQLGVFGARHDQGETLVLLGPLEPGFWARFTKSAEYCDAQPDPLDRWSKRVIQGLAQAFNGSAVFPSDGPPYPAFLSWAVESGRAWPSPVGMLVHDTAGLWVSYRGALRLKGHLPLAQSAEMPCTGCTQPCKTACPVNALGPEGYDTAACTAHIAGPDSADCRALGCAARRSCPASQTYARLPEQSAFHMKAFLKA